MSITNPRSDLVPTDYSQSRSFNVGLAKATSIEAALVFDELSFWWGKGDRQDGWIYKSYADMLERLPLSEYHLRKAYKLLDELGYIEISVKKQDGAPTFHYRILKNLSFHSEKTSETMETEKTSETTIYTATNTATNHKDFTDQEKIEERQYLEAVFSSLVLELGLKSALLTTERRKKVQARLKSFSVDDLVKVARILRNDPFMQGKNDQNRRYATIDYLIRKDEKIEEWLNQEPTGVPSRGFA